MYRLFILLGQEKIKEKTKVYEKLVRPRRLELPRISPQAPQACVSTNSTMAATGIILAKIYSKIN